MDAELKTSLDGLSSKIDDLKKSIEKIEVAHDKDHDALIRLEGRLEASVSTFDKHAADERDYGKGIDMKIAGLDKRMTKMAIIVSIIASAVGGGVGEALRMMGGL